ncbi:ABC transporter substrate-binding protein [Treponema pedis]|uniref:ABC transporter substrate-binding protein n=1 Tax=Treponema pedis TaxID=409322 RepID=A0A7S7AWJ7_9SPIR|nr:ABC transporter substrate-binding protein [Treponema pedis]QOW60967.1 ABC transporter substrate-binding protein [Treponema pedis]
MKTRFLSLMMLIILLAATACSKNKQTNSIVSAETIKMSISDVDLNDPNIDEMWKKEPRYGTPIQFAFNGGLCTSALGVNLVHGFFAKQGLTGEIKNMPSPFDALGTGKVDVMATHISESVVPAINGINMVFTSGVNTGCKTLFVLKDSAIKNTKDLEGQNVAIHDAIGGSDHNIILRFLARDSVDYSKVKFKNVETLTTIEAMKRGEIQASIFSDQFAQQFIDNGTLRAIRSITFDDDFKIEPCCILILNKDFVEQNPITAAKITKAHKEASYWMEENKKEAAEIISANNWGSVNPEVNQYFLETYNLKISDEATEKTLIDVINAYKTFGLIKKDADTTELLNKIWKPMRKN